MVWAMRFFLCVLDQYLAYGGIDLHRKEAFFFRGDLQNKKRQKEEKNYSMFGGFFRIVIYYPLL